MPYPVRAPRPHSGCLPQDEKERIEALGGFVSYMDCWRVNGTLAVSRAIGKEARGRRERLPRAQTSGPSCWGWQCRAEKVPVVNRVVLSIRL